MTMCVNSTTLRPSSGREPGAASSVREVVDIGFGALVRQERERVLAAEHLVYRAVSAIDETENARLGGACLDTRRHQPLVYAVVAEVALHGHAARRLVHAGVDVLPIAGREARAFVLHDVAL